MRRLLYISIVILCITGCKEKKSYQYDLLRLTSPVIFAGDSLNAYRDPAILFHDKTFYLFFTQCEIVGDSVYSWTAQSQSSDLLNWSTPKQITSKNQDVNLSRPGNVIRFNDEWILCLQSYPRPGYTKDQMPKYGNENSRPYILRSKDLVNWSEPELIKVRGDIPVEDMGRIIDPYFIKDKDEPSKWWCFYKHNKMGGNMSYTYDFKKWVHFGYARLGDNACVLNENNEYILFNSAWNGIGIKKSRTLQNWGNWGNLITLGQKEWEWAKGKITDATVLNLKNIPGIEAYVMFFRGSGPQRENEGAFDRNCSIGIAWSKDLINWEYPKQ